MTGETDLQRIRRIMREPEPEQLAPAPWTDAELEELMWQKPLNETDFPNQGFQLPSDENQIETENENQLHLQLP
jgi:hypothetical protein